MDKFPLCWQGRAIGEMTTEREALYTCFAVRCRLPEKGIWCAWAVGTQGELRLGVVEPCGDHGEICRRFSDRMAAPLGAPLRGELRRVDSCGEELWEPWDGTALQTPWLRQQLRAYTGVLVRSGGGRRMVAVPYAPEKTFPLEPLFCFAQIRTIHGKMYAVFAFDEQEQPVFTKKAKEQA